MIILSWNLQKINAEKARRFALAFGQLMNEVAGGTPFVLFVYENRNQPERVLDSLGTGIDASQLAKTWVDTGGASSVRENVLVISGNGASFEDAKPFTAWKPGFDARCVELHEAEKRQARAQLEQMAARSTRASTLQARERQVAKVERGTFRPADHFRSPVELTARFQDRRVRVLALHAPGPGAGAEHAQTFAEIYAEAIFASADGFDLVLGDFNLRTHGVRSNGFVDQGVRLGATTKGAEEGRHTYSRLDRVYARPGFSVSSALVSDGQERWLTDHHCLAVRIETRSQKLITDYFAFEPSPIRRQAVVYENRKRAFEAANATDLRPAALAGRVEEDVKRRKLRQQRITAWR